MGTCKSLKRYIRDLNSSMWLAITKVGRKQGYHKVSGILFLLASVHLRFFTEWTQKTLISFLFMNPLHFMNSNSCHLLMTYNVSGTVAWWCLDTVIFTPLNNSMYFYAYFIEDKSSVLKLIILHYNVFLLKRHFSSTQEWAS